MPLGPPVTFSERLHRGQGERASRSFPRITGWTPPRTILRGTWKRTTSSRPRTLLRATYLFSRTYQQFVIDPSTNPELCPRCCSRIPAPRATRNSMPRCAFARRRPPDMSFLTSIARRAATEHPLGALYALREPRYQTQLLWDAARECARSLCELGRLQASASDGPSALCSTYIRAFRTRRSTSPELRGGARQPALSDLRFARPESDQGLSHFVYSPAANHVLRAALAVFNLTNHPIREMFTMTWLRPISGISWDSSTSFTMPTSTSYTDTA